MKYMFGMALIAMFIVVLSPAFGLDYSQYTGTDWHLSIAQYGVGDTSMEKQLIYDNDLKLRIYSPDKTTAVWKLWKIIPHPPANEFYVKFKIKVKAQNIDLDAGNAGYASGEAEANDGPNVFAFLYYGTGGTTVDNPGFSPNSLSWSAIKGGMCHMHIECNYIGPDIDYIYCLNEQVYKGWLYDGVSLGDSNAVNKYDEEPISQDEWKTVVMHINSNECLHDNLTLVIMGADILANRDYEWEIKDVKIEYGDDEYALPLTKIYDEGASDYIPSPAFCGDGVKETPNDQGINEECDGSDGVPQGFSCTSDCKLEPVCGDGMVVDGEECDGSAPAGYSCVDCKLEPVCGDGKIVDGEVCDGNNVTTGYRCSSDCKSMTPICGDGIVVKGEECDGNSTEPGKMCVECKLINDIGAFSDVVDEIETTNINGTKVVDAYFPYGVSIKQEDISSYISAKGYAKNVSLCDGEHCDKAYAVSGSLQVPEGEVYFKVFNANGTIYIGMKGSKFDFLALFHNPAVLLIIGILIGLFILIVIGAIGVLAYIYYKKSKNKSIRLK